MMIDMPLETSTNTLQPKVRKLGETQTSLLLIQIVFKARVLTVKIKAPTDTGEILANTVELWAKLKTFLLKTKGGMWHN